jgi:hypothetical protein
MTLPAEDSSVASCSTFYLIDSCAFATTDSWPTGIATESWNGAGRCSVSRLRHRSLRSERIGRRSLFESRVTIRLSARDVAEAACAWWRICLELRTGRRHDTSDSPLLWDRRFCERLESVRLALDLRYNRANETAVGGIARSRHALGEGVNGAGAPRPEAFGRAPAVVPSPSPADRISISAGPQTPPRFRSPGSIQHPPRKPGGPAKRLPGRMSDKP